MDSIRCRCTLEECPTSLIMCLAHIRVWCCRYKPPSTESNPTLEDPTPDYMNLLGMIFSMCGLMLKVTRTLPHLPHIIFTCVCLCVHTKWGSPLNGRPWSSSIIPFRGLKVNSLFRWKKEGQRLTFSRKVTVNETRRRQQLDGGTSSQSNTRSFDWLSFPQQRTILTHHHEVRKYRCVA